MEIKNFTEYPLRLFNKSQCDYDQKAKRWIVDKNEAPVKIFPVVKTLKAPTEYVTISEELLDGTTTITIPIIQKKLADMNLSPEVDFGVVLVVSESYMSAIKSAGYSTEGLVTPQECWSFINGQFSAVGFVGLIV